MKRILTLMAMLVFASSLSFAEEWVGYVADATCAAKGNANSEGHAACAKKCVDGGAAIAFVVESDGKVYQIANQDSVTEHVGHKVTLTGSVEGETITVENVAM